MAYFNYFAEHVTKYVSRGGRWSVGRERVPGQTDFAIFTDQTLPCPWNVSRQNIRPVDVNITRRRARGD